MKSNFDVKSWVLLFSTNRELAKITLFSGLEAKSLTLSDDDLLIVWTKLSNFEKLELVAKIGTVKPFKRITDKELSLVAEIRAEYLTNGKLAAVKLLKSLTGCYLKEAADFGVEHGIW